MWLNRATLHQVAVVGVGSMGSAIIQSIKKSRNMVSIIGTVTSLDDAKAKFQKFKVPIHDSNKYLKGTKTAIIAVKPDKVEKVCQELKTHLPVDSTVVSVAAGIPLDRYYDLLGNERFIARCMPNISISTGSGAITWHCRSDHIAIFDRLLFDLFYPNSLYMLDSDKKIDESTVISGCSPAVISWLCRSALTKSNGALSADETLSLIRSSLVGTAKLLEQNTVDEIFDLVAPSGGVTDSMISYYKKKCVHEILEEGLHVADNRIDKLKSF